MFGWIKSVGKLKGMLPPLREVLSEDGVGSYSRYSGAVIIVSTIFWITYLVFKNHALPDLDGPAIFIASGQTQYAANQIKGIARAMKGGNPDPAQVTVAVQTDTVNVQGGGNVSQP